jgi:hypothetical protein
MYVGNACHRSILVTVYVKKKRPIENLRTAFKGKPLILRFFKIKTCKPASYFQNLFARLPVGNTVE